MDEELHLGGDIAPDETVAIVKTLGGLHVLAPRSIRSLRGQALEVSAELQHAVAQVELHRRQAYRLAAELRSLGASWSAIAWCLGLSESRARQIVAQVEEDLREQDNP